MGTHFGVMGIRLEVFWGCLWGDGSWTVWWLFDGFRVLRGTFLCCSGSGQGRFLVACVDRRFVHGWMHGHPYFLGASFDAYAWF